MVFYEIELHSLPRIIFAWHVKASHYQNKFSYNKNFLEITICDHGDIIREYNDGKREITVPGMISTITKDMEFKTHSNADYQEHTTVGVVCDYSINKHDSNTCDINTIKEKLKTGRSFLTPYIMELGEKYETISKQIYKIIHLYNSITLIEKLSTISEWFSLMAILTNIVIKKLNKSNISATPSGIRYAELAEKYIQNHFQDKITVSEIAEHLGISCGYLHSVFKNVTHSGITEYINNYRIDIAIRHLRCSNISLKEAGEMVGINDPAYLSRLFRKKLGVNYRTYFNSIYDNIY